MRPRQLTSLLTQLSRRRTTPSIPTPQRIPPHTRALHAPYKDSQERDSLKPRRNENTATGSDDEIAHMDSAYDTSHTNPEEELAESRGSTGWSMLDESGGNQAFSKPQGDSPSENRSGEKGNKAKSASVKGKKHGELKPKA